DGQRVHVVAAVDIHIAEYGAVQGEGVAGAAAVEDDTLFHGAAGVQGDGVDGSGNEVALDGHLVGDVEDVAGRAVEADVGALANRQGVAVAAQGDPVDARTAIDVQVAAKGAVADRQVIGPTAKVGVDVVNGAETSQVDEHALVVGVAQTQADVAGHA